MARPFTGGPRRRSAFTARLENTSVEGAQPRVLDDMRAAILAGVEPPGTLIPIDAVAAFFGVSQIPVREALKILLGEGLVEHVPHVGYSVAKLSYREFRELYEVRLALEAARAALLETSTALDAGDDRGYHEATRRFHLSLIAPSGMQRLLRMYESAWNLTEPVRPMTHVGPAQRSAFAHDHDAMLEAFESRDATALVALSVEHYDHLLDGIEVLSDDHDVFREA